MKKLDLLKMIATNSKNIETALGIVEKAKPVVDGVKSKVNQSIEEFVSSKGPDVSWTEHIANVTFSSVHKNNIDSSTETLYNVV